MRVLILIYILFLSLTDSGHKNKSDYKPVSHNFVSDINKSVSEDSLYIYLVRQRWHTGILFNIQMVDTLIWPEISKMRSFKQIDVGWGDEEFYQYPGFDAGLAVKALFYPTPSVLRIHGFNISSQRYAELSDMAVKLYLGRVQFDSLCSFISQTYLKDSSNNIRPTKKSSSERTVFYKAKNNYHLFNTCNTWVAKGLLKAGFDLDPAEIIFAEDLFEQAGKFGTFVTKEDHE